MKTFHYTCNVIIAGILFSACAAPVSVQKDNSVNLSRYKTYMWVDTKSDQNDNRNKATQFADISVHNAASEALAKYGWKEVQNDPDVLLSYDILVERSTQRQSDPVYSQPFTRLYYNPYMRRWGTLYYPSRLLGYDTYETPVREGTITISMVDAKNDKTIWQGWTTKNLERSRPSTAEISTAVTRILKKLEAGS